MLALTLAFLNCEGAMGMSEWINKRGMAPIRIAWRWVNYKMLALGLLAVAFFTFGDVLLSAIGQGMHILVEVIEINLEHFLEKTFDLTPRQAQFVLAYSALALVIYLCVYLTRKAYAAAQRAGRAAAALSQRALISVKSVQSSVNWRIIVGVLGAVGLAIYLFT
jgi:hypothetical protein